MKLLLLIFCLLTVSLSVKWHQLENYNFENYVDEYSKIYDDDEYNFRKSIFDKKLAEIKFHNVQLGQTYKKGVNQFTDRTFEEMQGYLGFNKTVLIPGEDVNATYFSYNSTEDLEKLKNIPKSIDWREKGVITPIKDQGRCGSCWAFTTIEQIESYLALNTGIQETLSVGEIAACTPNPNQCGGTGGCNGGTITQAMNYVKNNGITTEWKVPYQSYFGITPDCSVAMHEDDVNATKFIKSHKVQVGQPGKLFSNNYNDFMFHLAYVGPLGVYVSASEWHSYEEGIYNGCSNYSNVDLDHGVQIVGYGTDEKLGDYFLVRNSWGTSFGEEGYIRLSRNPKCGTDLFPQDNTACKAKSYSPMTVCGQCGILWGADFPINVTKGPAYNPKPSNSTSNSTINGTKINSTNSKNSIADKIQSIIHKFM